MRTLLALMLCSPAALAQLGELDLQLTPLVELNTVVDIRHARDATDRLFFVQKSGFIRIFIEGQLRDAPFLDVSDQVSRGSEQGLLSLAFAPDFAQSGVFYIYYTDTQGNSRLSRLTLGPDGNADPSSEEILLTLPQPFANHNGGRIMFGVDGMLYLSTGDGGSGGDPLEAAQNENSLLGKILRLEVSEPGNYRIPADNPFVENPDFRPEIWALGLRNPWRISFDRITGDLFIADVGQNALEEVNVQPGDSTGGENYGWDFFEATNVFEGEADRNDFVFPIAEYGRSLGCSVTGGEVYRGLDYPQLDGVYLYGDFCTGRIWGLLRQGESFSNALLLESGLQILTFGSDERGNLYVSDAATDTIFAISDGPLSTTATRAIDGQMSGTWVIENLPDQGFVINVGENDAGPFLFFAWFTFLDGQPFWLVGNDGFVEGAHSVVVPVQRLSGPDFLDFDVSAEREEIGNIIFRAVGCDGFEIDLQLGKLVSGLFALDRLTGIEGHGCEG